MDIDIKKASTPSDMDVVRMLFREYADALDFDLCFQGFEEELDGLPGRYAEPDGTILLAVNGEHPAACIALRPLQNEHGCEMKRLFVRADYRREGIGRLLATRLLAEARQRGYTRMRLDTVATMQPARNLYRSLGFYEIAAYTHNPIEEAVYMECSLIPETSD